MLETDMFADFSSEDAIVDATNTPLAKKIKCRVVGDSPAPSNKKLRLEETNTLIFKPDFYIDFEYIREGDKTLSSAKCTTCGKKIRGLVNVSSNFITHLKLKHVDIYNKYSSLKLNKQGSTADEFNGRVLRFVIGKMLPLSIIDSELFADMFHGTGLKVMCRQTARKKLDEHYESMQTKLKVDIQSCQHFCTTADIWSGNHRSFFGYTCHWLSDEFERKSVALACKRLSGTHSADHIFQTISEINSEFGLNSKNIVMTVTDNGSNFVKAFKDHGIEKHQTPEWEDEEETPTFENDMFLPRHHRCSSHTLNLLATTDLMSILKRDDAIYNRHQKVFEKCNNLWKKSNWPKSSEVIVNTIGSSLVVPVVTRWNSLYNAVTKLLQHKDVVNNLCEKLNLPNFISNEIVYLESYVMLLEPVAKALDFLQGEKNIKFGFLLPVIMTLSNKLQKISKNKQCALNSVSVELEGKLRVRFSKYFNLTPEADYAVTASILTPNVKLKWCPVLQTISPEWSNERIITRAIECILKFVVDTDLVSKVPISPMSEDEIDFFDLVPSVDESELKPSLHLGCSKMELEGVIKHQLHAYLANPLTNLSIWKEYDVLKQASLYFNTPLTSSAPVERLFSFAGILNDSRRQALADFSFEKLLLVKANNINI